MTQRSLLLLVLLLSASPAPGEGTTVRGGRDGAAVYSLHVPPGDHGKGTLPVLVALSPFGVTHRRLAQQYASLADRAGVVLLCPAAEGLGFRDTDLPRIEKAMEEVRKDFRAGPFHLFGVQDAGYQALRYALARPKLFRAVVTLGADAPSLRPGPGASRLRILLLKGERDRPAAGRKSLEPLRGKVEVAEMREVAGEGLVLDAATLAYVRYFLEAASGRCVAGKDRSLSWREPGRGLSERKALGSPALIYLYDRSPAMRTRTRTIQLSLFFDHGVRRAMDGAVAILAPRGRAAQVVPRVRLAPGPALVVLDRAGKVAGVLQKNLSAKALLALLRRG